MAELATPQFEAIISSAVDRQVGEQRALQETLQTLRERVEVFDGRLDGLVERIGAVELDVRALTEAILQLNTGLRGTFGSLEERVGTLATTLLGTVRDVATTQQAALEDLGRALGTSTGDLAREISDRVRDGMDALGTRVDEVRDKLGESNDLAAYLRDQSDDLDRVLAGLGEVPRKLEGVVAQALRRALTVRAGLIKEAEKALDRALGPVESRLSELTKELGSVRKGGAKGKAARDEDEPSEQIRRLALQQVELATKLEDLQAWLGEALEDAESDRRSRDEELIRALGAVTGGAVPAPQRAVATRTATSKPAKAKPSKAKSSKAKASKVKPAKPTSSKPTSSKPTSSKATTPRSKAKTKTARSGAKRSRSGSTSKDAERTPQPSRRRRNYIPV